MSKRDQNRYIGIDHLHDDLAGRSTRGGAVTIFAQIVKVVVQLGTIVILGRLLNPHAFGLIAMVAVVLTFVEAFKDLGLSTATIQRQNITHGDVSTLFWVNASLGTVAALIVFAAAPLLAWFYGEPELTGITRWLCLGFVLGGLSTQHLALLRRQMKFSALAFIQVGAEIAGMSAAVFAAYEGAGYWSLVVQRLVWALLMLAGTWAFCGWRPGPPMRLGKVKELLGFGGNVTLSNLINYSTQNLDQVLIGWYWGAAPLGLYDRAHRFLLVPINNLNTPLFAVAMPALSRLAGDAVRYRRAYLMMIEKLIMITMPGAALLIAIPDVVVRVLFGEKWLGAAPILGWLAIAALYQPVSYTCSWLLMSQNRTGEMPALGLIGSCVTVLAVVLGLPFGAVGVAAAYALSGLCLRVPFLFWVVGRRGPVSSSDLYRAMMPAAVASALVLVAIWSLRKLHIFAAMTPLEMLFATGFIAMALALAAYLILPQGREAMRDFRRLSGFFLKRGANA
ncbi:MAG: lipopolysaccharide biosynthesis protein [Parvibaculum sp.]|uniref:lipopolysaccharide biosynthesis protein n=1 Tax=Parvibaculum sp. TaxID=2024848 RepID=UPI0035BB0295